MSLLSSTEKYLQDFMEDTVGATIVEYALLVGIVSALVGFMIPEIMSTLDMLFVHASSGLESAVSGRI